MKKIVYFNQYLFIYFLLTFHASKAATHWVVTEDGKIHTQEDSIFQMRRPYDLMSFLQQEKRADVFSKIKNQLLLQKEEIESENFDSHEDVEQLIFLTDSDCIKARKPLTQIDLYVGTLLFSYPKNDRRAFPEKFPVKNFLKPHELVSSQDLDDLFYQIGSKNQWLTFTSSNTSAKNPRMDSKSVSLVELDDDVSLEQKQKFAPNCSDYQSLDFSMTTFEHLPSVRDRKDLRMDAEPEIIRYLGKWDFRTFGKDISDGLKQNSTSWILYTLATFYWRGLGNGEQAIECARRALHYCPLEYRALPLLSLATILHRAHSYEEATIVLHGAINTAVDIPHAHYILANIYAVLTDYNKSVICFDNVLKLLPKFQEAIQRKHAVLCHGSIENALKAQHETLQKTLDDLKDYQRQQELWINYHKKLRAEQAPPNVLLEQRLHYREFQIRQKLEDENFIKEKLLKQRKNSEEDDGGSSTKINQIQIKLEKQGQRILDFYLNLDEHGQKSNDIDEDDGEKTNNNNEDDNQEKPEDNERSVRIKKLLASSSSASSAAATGNNNELNDSSDRKSLPIKEIDSSTNDDDNDGDEDDSNKVVGAGDTPECDSRPMLIPVSFVLPPSN